MSFSAEMEVMGHTHPLRFLKWSVLQEQDALGRPNAIARSGQIEVQIDSSRDEHLIDWMFNPRKKQNGLIRLLRPDGQGVLKNIAFHNAFCVLLKGNFDGTFNQTSATKTLLISAERLTVQDIEIFNNWPA